MRKIDEIFENPIDNQILEVCEKLLPLFRKYKFTPNMLTTISNIFTLLGLYYFIKNRPWLFYIYVWIGYFFDCMDGHYARAYNMTSVFGDYYDHISDITLLSSFAYLFYLFFGHHFSLEHTFGKIFVIAVIIWLFLLGKHVGCQERYYEKSSQQSQSLALLKYFCPNKDAIHWTKHFGVGTSILLFYTLALILMLYYH